MPEENGTGTLENALQTLRNAVVDLTSLEVMTFTGPLDVEVDSQNGGLPDFDSLLDTAKTKGRLKLQYASKISFDGDGLVLVPDAAPKSHILEAHEAAVLAGQEVRQGLMALFSDITGLITK